MTVAAPIVATRIKILLNESHDALEAAHRIVARLSQECALSLQDQQAIQAAANQARASASALDKLSGMLWYHEEIHRAATSNAKQD